MTIPNRSVSITGIFAADASTTIPLNPVPGASYRDTTMTGTVVREGWAFKTIVDSSKFNQAMYEYSSVTAQIEKYGFLPWSNLTDYVEGSVCLGSNGMLYQAKQATGPLSTAVDPTTDSSVWQQIILGNTNSLFDHKWEDYQLNRMDWLRADTFSWQDGTVYSNAYNHLADEFLSGQLGQSETIAGITIFYNLAPDGHKIVDASYSEQVQHVEDIYNATGVAWYYILDTTNQRFKLPRTKYGFVGLRDAVGKYVPETLPTPPSHTHNVGNIPQGQTDGGADIFRGGNDDVKWKTVTSSGPSWSSSNVYQNNAPVQQRATQMYLYFYVGQFSQSATEQTAGLNTELFNGKADVDLSNAAPNASASAKETIVGWGIPDYTSGTSVSAGVFTPTSNGILVILGENNLGKNFRLYIGNSSSGTQIAYGAVLGADGGCTWFIPLLKNTDYYISGTLTSCNFYPYLGEIS